MAAGNGIVISAHPSLHFVANIGIRSELYYIVLVALVDYGRVRFDIAAGKIRVNNNHAISINHTDS